jgi:hypothetical protein
VTNRRVGYVPSALACAALLAIEAPSSPPRAGPFAFFEPTVTVAAADRSRLERGEPIVLTLPGEHRQVVVFAAVPVEIDGDRLVAWVQQIDALKRSSYVPSIGRFSNPPTLDDLNGLTLDDDDLSAIRACKPKSCNLKLTEAELGRLQQAATDAGSGWRSALQSAFRVVVLQRVKTYLAGGLQALPPYVDDKDRIGPAARFAPLVEQSRFLTERLPRFAEYLARYPNAPMPGLETFVYWSKERLAGKTIIVATDVSILRPGAEGLPDALVAGKQIFATHYLDASLGFTAIVRGDEGSHNYLAYLNRSDVDVLGGAFGGLVRWFMERRLRSEAADVLEGLKGRLESGPPPTSTATSGDTGR